MSSSENQKFIIGYCWAVFESYHYGQRHVLRAAWDDTAIVASTQEYPKLPTGWYTAENIETASHALRAVWNRAHGIIEPSLLIQPKECRIYRDDTILYISKPGVVWVVPVADKVRVEFFTESTIRKPWLFEGGSLPSVVTSRPAAMAAFTHSGLV